MALASITPKAGTVRKGSSAVTVRGSASVIHQIAINRVSAATCQAVSSMPAGAGRSSMVQKTTRPPIKPNQRVLVIAPPVPSLLSLHLGEDRDDGYWMWAILPTRSPTIGGHRNFPLCGTRGDS